MMKWVYGLCLIGLGFIVEAQAQTLPKQYAFRVSFVDKSGTADIHNPISFLSQRSIDRRLKYGIAIDSADLPVSPAYLDSVKTFTSGIIHTTSKWLNNCVVLVTDTTTIPILRTKPFVSNVVWIGEFSSGLHNKPASHQDEKFSVEYSHVATTSKLKPTGTAAFYGAAWDQTRLINGDCLHDKGWMGQGILIAILDNGFQYVDTNPGFDSLRNSGRIIDTYNIARDTGYVYNTRTHGTECLSIMAGYVPGTYVGAAPLADYALYITEDAGFEKPIELDNMVAGMERADSIGADVISMSIGYISFDAPFTSFTATDLDGKTTIVAKAANMAMAKGIFTVSSAGNEGTAGLLTPGDADSIMTVGNVNINKVPAASSSYGPNASGTVKPNIAVMGNPGKALRIDTNAINFAGTSAAAPNLAGFTACLLQGNIHRTPYELRNAIQQTGHIYPLSSPQTGYGVPDMCVVANALSVDENKKLINNITVYPNPTKESFTVSFTSQKSTLSTFIFSDILGRTIFKEEKTATKGPNIFRFEIGHYQLAQGVYILQIKTAKKDYSFKVGVE